MLVNLSGVANKHSLITIILAPLYNIVNISVPPLKGNAAYLKKILWMKTMHYIKVIIDWNHLCYGFLESRELYHM